jgi:hypothetical protein
MQHIMNLQNESTISKKDIHVFPGGRVSQKTLPFELLPNKNILMAWTRVSYHNRHMGFLLTKTIVEKLQTEAERFTCL